MKNKRVFVTGGAGIIGTALVEKLLEQHYEVFVGDLKPCPKRWLGKVRYRQGDLNEMIADEIQAFDPHVVFHLAATFERSEESYPFFGENYHHNILLTHHLLNCIKDNKSLSRFVLASSYLIYNPDLYQSSTERKGVCSLTENSQVLPRNLCGAAKFHNELELEFLSHFKGDISFLAARIFRVYGRGSRDIISRWIRSALRKEKLTVYRPEGKFDYIFADDAAEGLLRLAATHESGIVNLGTGRARSINEVLKILKFHFKDLEIEDIPSDIFFENSEASVQKLESLTGWKPPHNLETGIEKLIEFEKSTMSASSIGHKEAKANVLITSISKKMPLISAVRQAASKTGLYTFVYGCDSHISCIGQYGVDEFWNCPTTDRLSIDDFISYCQEKNVKALIPTRDDELGYFAENKERLAESGIHTMISEKNAIETCLDKYKFAQVLTKHQLSAIKTELSLQNIKAEKYVVKERRGAGSQSIGLNLPKEETLKHSKSLKDPIFQPFIEGKEWSVDLYRTKEGHVKGIVARQRNLVVGGESQVTTTVNYPALEQLCHQIADHLNLYGHAVFQVIEDWEGKLHVIECNPRFGGASTASVAAGLDSFLWFLMETAGISLESVLFLRSKKEIKQVRYIADKIILEQ